MLVKSDVEQTVVALLKQYGRGAHCEEVILENEDIAKQVIQSLEEIAISERTATLDEAIAVLMQIENVHAAESLARVLCACCEDDYMVECFIGEIMDMKNPKLRAWFCNELIEIVNRKDHPARIPAVRCLSVADNDESIFRLLVGLLQDECIEIAEAAADILLDMDECRALVPIMRHCIFNDKLGWADFFIFDYLETASDQTDKCKNALHDDNQDIRFSAALALYVSESCPRAEKIILMYHMLHDSCWQLRELVAMVFEYYPKFDYTPDYMLQAALIQALQDDEQDVAESAMSALGALGDEMAVQPLMDILDTDENEGKRLIAARVLGTQLVAPRSIELLTRERDRMRPCVKEDDEWGNHWLSILDDAVWTVNDKIRVSKDIEKALSDYFAESGIG